MHNVHPAPVADREHSAAWAAVLDLDGLHRHPQTVLIGPAGTGKATS